MHCRPASRPIRTCSVSVFKTVVTDQFRESKNKMQNSAFQSKMQTLEAAAKEERVNWPYDGNQKGFLSHSSVLRLQQVQSQFCCINLYPRPPLKWEISQERTWVGLSFGNGSEISGLQNSPLLVFSDLRNVLSLNQLIHLVLNFKCR